MSSLVRGRENPKSYPGKPEEEGIEGITNTQSRGANGNRVSLIPLLLSSSKFSCLEFTVVKD
jgi:hypothetical protein